MPEVIYAEKWLRVGWYCPVCAYFRKAIWRERKVLGFAAPEADRETPHS
jgi:hypothetical protein